MPDWFIRYGLWIWLAGIFLMWPPFLWWRYRQIRGRGFRLWPTAPIGSQFVQRDASGGGAFGANRCLFVAVSGGELLVTPTFPFNLFSIGLVHRIPLIQIEWAIEQLGHSPSLSVKWRDEQGGGKIRLVVKDQDALVRALDVRTTGA